MPASVLLPALVLLAQPADAACPADLGILRSDLKLARQTYVDEDWEAFQGHLGAVEEDLGCLVKVATPEDALAVHLLYSLGCWMERDESRVAFGLRGVVALDPYFHPGEDVMPEGKPLMVRLVRARETGTGLSAIHDHKLIVDGHRGTRAVPMQRATLVQFKTEEGLQTLYASPDGPPQALFDRIPYGWRREGDILLTVTQEQTTLETLVAMADQGATNTGIAQALNDGGLLRGSEPWTAVQVEAQLAAQAAGALEKKKRRRQRN